MDNDMSVRESVELLLKGSPKTFFTVAYIADICGYSEKYIAAVLATMPVERESVKDGGLQGRGKLIVRWGR